MRFACMVACFLVAAEFWQKATGAVPQSLFAPDAIWLHGLVAAGWALNGVYVALRGAP